MDHKFLLSHTQNLGVAGGNQLVNKLSNLFCSDLPKYRYWGRNLCYCVSATICLAIQSDTPYFGGREQSEFQVPLVVEVGVYPM